MNTEKENVTIESTFGGHMGYSAGRNSSNLKKPPESIKRINRLVSSANVQKHLEMDSARGPLPQPDSNRERGKIAVYCFI